MAEDTSTVVAPAPQANPKPHPVDWLALLMVGLGALTQFEGILPVKYVGPILFAYALAKTYTKWLGSREQKDALDEGRELGQELQTDLEVMNAKKAEPVK